MWFSCFVIHLKALVKIVLVHFWRKKEGHPFIGHKAANNVSSLFSSPFWYVCFWLLAFLNSVNFVFSFTIQYNEVKTNKISRRSLSKIFVAFVNLMRGLKQQTSAATEWLFNNKEALRSLFQSWQILLN